MIKREDFNGKTYEEMLAAMEAEIVVYKEQVANYATMDECVAEEQVIMASMDEVQARLNTVEYELPKETHYENKRYSKKDIATKIVYFLNKIECKFEQTLGIHQLISLWKSDMNSISYRVYDSTLRCLNTVTFKGDSELVDILATNEYLSQCHNEYSLDTGMLLFLSECHNCVMNRMKELDPASNVPASLEE
jgi:hypothetical protein